MDAATQRPLIIPSYRIGLITVKVKELVKHLQNFMLVNPHGGEHEIMLKYDGDVCIEFGRADRASGIPGQYLVFVPLENGKKFGIRDVKIN